MKFSCGWSSLIPWAECTLHDFINLTFTNSFTLHNLNHIWSVVWCCRHVNPKGLLKDEAHTRYMFNVTLSPFCTRKKEIRENVEQGLVGDLWTEKIVCSVKRAGGIVKSNVAVFILCFFLYLCCS